MLGAPVSSAPAAASARVAWQTRSAPKRRINPPDNSVEAMPPSHITIV